MIFKLTINNSNSIKILSTSKMKFCICNDLSSKINLCSLSFLHLYIKFIN